MFSERDKTHNETANDIVLRMQQIKNYGHAWLINWQKLQKC